MPASLIDIVRKRFLETIRSVQPPGRWKVVVIDEHAQRLLGAVLKQYDVLEENVTLIESVSSYRQPQPGLEAIYFLMATTQNVDRVIQDFSGTETTYEGAHLFFMDSLPEHLFNRLCSSPAERYLKRLSDLNINFRALESQTFSLHAPQHFFSFYSPPPSSQAVAACRARIEEDLLFTAKGILNVCISINENPLIRYYVPDHPPLGALTNQTVADRNTRMPPSEGSGRWKGALASAAARVDLGGITGGGPNEEGGDHLSKKLAFMVQRELDDYAKANPDFIKTAAPNRPKPVLIITERAMDMFAPFLHEFTYQAMCNDLLNIEGGVRYRFKFQTSSGKYEDEIATLSETDTMWTEIRHHHMQEAIEKLMKEFNQFLEENAGFRGGDAATSVNDMKDMLAGMDQFKEQRQKFSVHLNMAQESMDIYGKKHLENVAKVEQNCSTGLTVQGKAPKTLVEDMVPLLADQTLTGRDKVRIIAVYIQFRQGIPDEDKKRLFQHAGLSLSEQDAVNSLVNMGVRVLRTPADRDLRKMKQKPADDDYDLSRYQPLLKTVIDDQINNRLDASQFPYVRNAPGPSGAGLGAIPPPNTRAPPTTTSLRSSKPSWHRAPSKVGGPGGNVNEKDDKNRQKMIVFVLGGMTYSEMRTAYRMSDSSSKDIYIGSSHIYTPNEFIDDLKVLEHGGVGSQAAPNGLQSVEVRGEPRPYQMAYDQKYYVKDPPPPPPAQPAPRQNPAPESQNRLSGASQNHLNPLAGLGNSTSPSIRSNMSGGSTPDGREKEKKKRFFKF
ncbi:vacuolar sorting protein VPS33/slp1 [Tulasnella sp. 331]|nr:vacuolar sorting protein VPS33/slp1 [Tulasnella sp. 331]KAG8882292.1 vacuolar sorting protein VPS33/slp1 [Tulasnella sp. 332]